MLIWGVSQRDVRISLLDQTTTQSRLILGTLKELDATYPESSGSTQFSPPSKKVYSEPSLVDGALCLRKKKLATLQRKVMSPGCVVTMTDQSTVHNTADEIPSCLSLVNKTLELHHFRQRPLTCGEESTFSLVENLRLSVPDSSVPTDPHLLEKPNDPHNCTIRLIHEHKQGCWQEGALAEFNLN